MLLTFVRVKYGWKIGNFDNWKKETFWYSIGYSIKKHKLSWGHFCFSCNHVPHEEFYPGSAKNWLAVCWKRMVSLVAHDFFLSWFRDLNSQNRKLLFLADEVFEISKKIIIMGWIRKRIVIGRTYKGNLQTYLFGLWQNEVRKLFLFAKSLFSAPWILDQQARNWRLNASIIEDISIKIITIAFSKFFLLVRKLISN